MSDEEKYTDTQDSTPVAITYLDSSIAALMVDAAKYGVASLGESTVASSAVLLEGVTHDDNTNYSASMTVDGANAFDYIFGNAGLATQATIIIVNMLDTPLRLRTNGFQKGDRAGFQKHHPAQLSGSTFVSENIIPAAATGASPRYAVGVYKYEGRLGIFHQHDIHGVLEFAADGHADDLALAFRVTSDDHCVAVTMNAANYGTLDAFYKAWVDGQTRNLDSSAGETLDAYASITTWTGVYLDQPRTEGEIEKANQVITLAVLPKS